VTSHPPADAKPETVCVLCEGGNADVSRIRGPYEYEVTCPRCGKYRLTREAKVNISSRTTDSETRLRLTWAARQGSELEAPLEFSTDNIEDFARSVVEPHPPTRKLDLVVQWVGRRIVALGQTVTLNIMTDWPLFYTRNQAECKNLIRNGDPLLWTGAWVPGNAAMVQVSLTPVGWDRFERLEAEKPKSDVAFVAMRFNEEMQAAYDEGFHPALYELGYRPIRVDHEQYLGKIDAFIFASIRKSGLLIADFTEMRTGVFFEAGFGMGLGIPVVWTCRQDWSSKLGDHFDTRQYNHLIWTDPPDLKTKLRLRIEAAVIGRPKPRT
jgi:hypothetical protein